MGDNGRSLRPQGRPSEGRPQRGISSLLTNVQWRPGDCVTGRRSERYSEEYQDANNELKSTVSICRKYWMEGCGRITVPGGRLSQEVLQRVPSASGHNSIGHKAAELKVHQNRRPRPSESNWSPSCPSKAMPTEPDVHCVLTAPPRDSIRPL